MSFDGRAFRATPVEVGPPRAADRTDLAQGPREVDLASQGRDGIHSDTYYEY